jgi:uncharacterized C2H2 Zn-finger protein
LEQKNNRNLIDPKKIINEKLFTLKIIFLSRREQYLAVKCPECDYVFSDKGDFSKYEVGETLQCPVCKTELKVNKDKQLEVLDLESEF